MKIFHHHQPLFSVVPLGYGRPLTLWALLFGGGLLLGCASTAGTRVVLQQDSTVYVGQDKGVAKKRMDSFETGNEPALIEAPGYASLYLVPLPGDHSGSEVKATLHPLQGWSDEQSKKKLNQLLNEVVPKLSDIQILMANGHSKEALLAIEQLKAAYPSLSYLNFLHASCLILVGERDKARTVLQAALRDFPDNEEGRALFKLLRGDERSIPSPSNTTSSPLKPQKEDQSRRNVEKEEKDKDSTPSASKAGDSAAPVPAPTNDTH